MLKYLFARLWKNPLSRYGMIAAITLILFGVIFTSRNQLYRFFSRTFSSADWSDVVRHGAKPFGFEENESKARDLTGKAWRDIYALSEKKIGDSEKIEPLSAPVTRKPYSQFLRKHAEEEIFMLFNGLFANCGTLITSTEISDREKPLGNVASAQTVAGKLRSHMTATEKSLLRIHATEVEAALQKKPDFVPAIELSEEIFRATCGMRDLATIWARAIDYREYYLQKQLYEADSGKLYDKHPELFHQKALESYRRDAQYRELLQHYFDTTRFRTPHNPAQLKNLREAYAAFPNAKSLTALIAGLLAEARNSNATTAKKSHFELYALDYAGVTDRPDYLYALAETALRGDEPARAANIINNALKSGKIRDASLQHDFEWLQMQLELTRHDSENLSRF